MRPSRLHAAACAWRLVYIVFALVAGRSLLLDDAAMTLLSAPFLLFWPALLGSPRMELLILRINLDMREALGCTSNSETWLVTLSLLLGHKD
jgi:hypothetical protein